MTLKQIKDIIKKQLKETYQKHEIASLLKIILQNTLNITSTEIITKEYDNISEQSYKQIKDIIHKLKKNIPIQYVFNSAYFYGENFYVDENVLIPRQETELLVDTIIKQNQNNNIKILDIGTGSGIISITLSKHLTNSEIYACDISEKALLIAQKNANKLGAKVNFFKMDILQPLKYQIPNTKFDIIVSNPPYVTESEKKIMMPNVLDYEPHIALFVPDKSPLLFYEAILRFADKNLKNNGKIYFEINEKFGNKIKELFKSHNFSNIQIIKDLNNKNRFAIANKTNLPNQATSFHH